MKIKIPLWLELNQIKKWFKTKKTKRSIIDKTSFQLKKSIEENLTPDKKLTLKHFYLGIDPKDFQMIKPFLNEINAELAVMLEENCESLGIDYQSGLSVNLYNLDNTMPRIKKMDDFFQGIFDDGAVTKNFYRFPQEKDIENWILKIIDGPDQGRQFLVTSAEMKLGRKIDNHIYLTDPKVSRYHATLKHNEGRLFIKDLESTNGVRVNHQLIRDEKEIVPGDQIKIGETIIEIIKI